MMFNCTLEVNTKCCMAQNLQYFVGDAEKFGSTVSLLKINSLSILYSSAAFEISQKERNALY